MHRTSTEVTLLLPGLESASAALSDEPVKGPMLAEARMSWADDPSRPWEVSLQHALGLNAGDTVIPMARALCLSDHMASSSMPVVCADPVHFKPDRDTASLVPGRVMSIEPGDAQALITSLNEFVREDGLEFEFHHASRWILRGVAADDLATFPPHYLAERSISPYLSTSRGDHRWQRWQTEWQMLLHSHPVNQTRMAAGKLPINSLWIWGGGALADASAVSALVYTNDDDAKALCRGFGVPSRSLADLPELNAELNAEQPVARVVILDTSLLDAWMARNAEQLTDSLRDINNELIPALVDAFDRNRLSRLAVVTEDGHRATLQAAAGWLSRLHKTFMSP